MMSSPGQYMYNCFFVPQVQQLSLTTDACFCSELFLAAQLLLPALGQVGVGALDVIWCVPARVLTIKHTL